MVKVRLLISGQVQGVGYRAIIKQIARNLHIKGRVKNIDDGSVEVYCEIEENLLDKFKRAIEIKNKNNDPFSLNVQNINTYFENDKEYNSHNAPKIFSPFEVDYGEEANTKFEQANLERLELASVGFVMLKDSVNAKFDTMESKYHNIHKDLEMLTYTIMVFAEHFAPEDQNIKKNLEILKERIN
ncbi:MAG: acylphosphatase [Candidatus Micrarchaeia archaeon]|jgi:acylphosphatase